MPLQYIHQKLSILFEILVRYTAKSSYSGYKDDKNLLSFVSIILDNNNLKYTFSMPQTCAVIECWSKNVRIRPHSDVNGCWAYEDHWPQGWMVEGARWRTPGGLWRPWMVEGGRWKAPGRFWRLWMSKGALSIFLTMRISNFSRLSNSTINILYII